MIQGRKLWKLFFTTLYISAFTFGGGFVIVTFMKRKFVDDLHWINEEEMLDIVALAESSPGAIAVNVAILMGWHMCGFIGMVMAVLGTILPPMIILSIISLFYATFATNQYVALMMKGMQAGVAAVIFDVVLSLGSNIIKKKKIIYYIIMVVAFFAILIFDVKPVLIIVGAIVVAIILETVGIKRGTSK